jgi:hypothetical protein
MGDVAQNHQKGGARTYINMPFYISELVQIYEL